MHWCRFGGENQVSPALLVPGIELRLLGLAAGAFTPQVISIACSLVYICVSVCICVHGVESHVPQAGLELMIFLPLVIKY